MPASNNSPRILITDPSISSPPNVLGARSPRAIKSQDPVSAGISTSPLAFTTLGPSVLGSGNANVSSRAHARDREREREIEAENRERQRAQDLESAMSMCKLSAYCSEHIKLNDLISPCEVKFGRHTSRWTANSEAKRPIKCRRGPIWKLEPFRLPLQLSHRRKPVSDAVRTRRGRACSCATHLVRPGYPWGRRGGHVYWDASGSR